MSRASTGSQTIGDLAEAEVTSWGVRGGFTVSSPGKDRHGWDRLLQLAIPTQTPTPLDLPPADLVCKVQVKGSGAQRFDRVRVGLNPMFRLVQSPMPCFLVAVHFREDLTVRSAHLIHVDASLIERCLHRWFTTPPESRQRTSVSVALSDAHLLNEPFGLSLRSSIEHAIDGDMTAYCVKKNSIRDSVGWPERPHSFTMTFSASDKEELYEQMAEAALGLGTRLRMQSYRETIERFGISHETGMMDDGETEEGWIEFEPGEDAHGWRATFRRSDLGRSVEAAALMMFTGSVFPNLPERYWRVRVGLPYLDIVVSVASGTANITTTLPSPDTEVPLAALAKTGDVFCLLRQTPAGRIDVELARDATRLPLITGSLVGLPDNMATVALTCAARAGVAYRALELPPDAVISLQKLVELRPQVEMIAAAFSSDPIDVQFEATVPNDTATSGQFALVTDPTLVVGKRSYGAVVALSGTPEVLWEKDGDIRVCVRAQRVESFGRLSMPVEEMSTFSVEPLIDEAESRLKKGGVVHVMAAPWLEIFPPRAGSDRPAPGD